MSREMKAQHMKPHPRIGPCQTVSYADFPKPTHTPGPWGANEDGLVYSHAPRLGKHNVICAVGPDDARLIASAPELLAACQGALACLHSGDLTPDMALKLLRAAIAKATGGDR